jgi:tetratricopeptide (TPR) repeat protein
LWARARKEWDQQQYDAAESSLTSVLALAPDHVEATRMLGVAAQRRGDHAKAVGCFRRVLAMASGDAALLVNLGIALHEQGDVEEALAHLRRACEMEPRSSSTWFNLGKALEKQAYTLEAVDAFRRVLEVDRAHVAARLSLARVLVSLGDVETATMSFREVLHRDPRNAEAWFGLSNINTIRLDAADTDFLRREFAREKLSAHDYELIGSAFAKALENQGDYAQAFETYRLVKASQRRSARWDASKERERIEAIARVFSHATPPPVDKSLGHEAILIVSLPRSGSTLVEQILASHPQVEGANEIRDMQQLIDAEARRRASPFPSWAMAASAEDWHRLGAEYLARTARWHRIKPRFTDKNLWNWPLVGAALTMLPAARVVIVRRDPVETCLACYRQYFTGRAGFACDLDDMADYCADFLRLTRFWLERFPGRIFDLEYETLLAAPDATIERLLDFCGLPFDSACLRFHETSRPVLSAPSAAQVRQPLHQDTARSARYGHKLDGLRQRLREAGVLTK